jgi:hypothetical protein
MISTQKLDFYIQHGYNVLFTGRHGVGKTAVVTEAFDRHKLNWRYYSAATLDPWVDLIGVPKEMKNGDGESYLDLVRPKEWQRDEVDAVFFDEFNRSHKKIRNAVMELIQFRSINGRKFNRLKMVWAAINPEDDDDAAYDVEPLDPAQRDRFHIKIDIPFKPHKPFFVGRYGEAMSKAAISWWEDLPAAIQKLVSPRCLDYALDVHGKKGDLRDVLPTASNVSKLIAVIKSGPVKEVLAKFKAQKDAVGATAFLAVENNYMSAIDTIVKSDELLEFFLPLLPSEKIAACIAAYPNVLTLAVQGMASVPAVRSVVLEAVNANTNIKLVKAFKKLLKKQPNLKQYWGITSAASLTAGSFGGGTTVKPVISKTPVSAANWVASYQAVKALIGKSTQTYTRINAYVDLATTLLLPKLTTVNAVLLLDLLDRLARSFQVNTLKKLGPPFVGVLNHLIEQICKNESIKWDEFDAKYLQQSRPKLRRKLAQDPTLSRRVLVP